MIGHKVLEGGNETTSKLPVLFTEKTSHLTETDIQFIKDWEALISVEEKNSRSSSKDIWTLEVKEREKKGSCIGGLKILMSSVVGTKGRFSNLIKFGKSSGVGSQSPTRSLVDSNSGDGDPVVVLQQNSRHPLAIGIVQTLTATTISVMVDKHIKSDGDDSITYTIDKDSFAGGLNLVRGNLYGLFLPGGARLRDLIVSLVPPTFNDVNNSLISDIQAKLNPDQRNAILRSIGCSDYSLILGMPGTGKTSTMYFCIDLVLI
jgi:DNA replication ATP-dependent helicase Dna2